MKRRTFLSAGGAGLIGITGLTALSAGALSLAGCSVTGPKDSSTDNASKRREIDAGVDETLNRLYSTARGSHDMASKASGMLVFPKLYSAGFIVGGEFGDGALRSGGTTHGYYRSISGSIGWQAGAQSKAFVIMFMTPDSYRQFVNSSGWTAGADASVAVATIGANGAVDTNTARQPVVGFVMTNAGLFGGAKLDGTKITKLDI